MGKIKIVKKDRPLFEGRYLGLWARHFLDRNGEERVWEMIKRTHGHIASIAALTPKNELVLLRQYRIALQSYILELPAGLRDKKETEKALIRRELLEETGYTIKKVSKLFEGPLDIGRAEDLMTIYLGEGAQFKQKPEPEPSEDIEILITPLNRVTSLLLHPPKKTLVDFKLWATLFLLREKGYNI